MKNIYLCGPTVYNTPHIGNLRPILTFDIVIKSLRFQKNKVNFIHNITDIDDKIIQKSIEENISEKDVAEKYTKEYLDLLVNYNIEKPNYMPKVTDNINEIINFIKIMLENGDAYEREGSVYFSIENDSSYGELSNRKINEMKFEESNKNHPGDFALWKKTSTGITFDSPWSKGRPGWHTECAVFVHELNNNLPLDLHGGGIDLLFPHHENENSQYKSVNKKKITKEWKHIGHLSINDQKMSKTLGNGIGANNFIKKYGADTLRMLILNASPTGPIDINKDLLFQTQKLVQKFSKSFLKAQLNAFDENANIDRIANLLSNWEFSKAMKEVNNFIKEFNKNGSYSSELIKVMKLLSFNFSKKTVSDDVKKLYKEWIVFREKRNFENADILRKKLEKIGII